MLRLNFEKAVIFVLILILLISTVNIYGQYIVMLFPDKNKAVAASHTQMDYNFPTMLLLADKYYKEGDYKLAQSEYVSLILTDTLNAEQKAMANYKLGICYFMLKDYKKARDSFLASLDYNANDPMAYNNASVCAYYLKDFKKALEYQKNAIDSLPVVEYYYNLGRIYETMGDFGNAVRHYMAVLKGEDNITRDHYVDPVHINNKILKMIPDESKRNAIGNNMFIAFKLRDTRELLMVPDAQMELTGYDFKMDLTGSSGAQRLYGSFDRQSNDPYHLINSLLWTVKSKGKVIYIGKKDDFSIRLSEDNQYEVSLGITYNGNKEKTTRKTIALKGNEQKVDVPDKQYEPPKTIPREECNIYDYAAYEQLFGKKFDLSGQGYTDRFNVEWGKDNIETKIMDKDFIDNGASLYINNNSDTDAGIWANLTTLLEDKQLKGKFVSVKFFGRKVSDDAKFDVKIRVRSERVNNTFQTFNPDYKWRQYSMELYIPENANGFTFSLNVNPGQRVKIDGFIISIIR